MKKIINGYEYEVIDWDLVKELVPAKLPILPENSFMYALHVKGWTFEEIGKLYGVTSQRVGVRNANTIRPTQKLNVELTWARH